MNRQQRARLVVRGAAALMLGMLAWTLYAHGWEALVRELVGLALVGAVLITIIIWTERGRK